MTNPIQHARIQHGKVVFTSEEVTQMLNEQRLYSFTVMNNSFLGKLATVLARLKLASKIDCIHGRTVYVPVLSFAQRDRIRNLAFQHPHGRERGILPQWIIGEVVRRVRAELPQLEELNNRLRTYADRERLEQEVGLPIINSVTATFTARFPRRFQYPAVSYPLAAPYPERPEYNRANYLARSCYHLSLFDVLPGVTTAAETEYFNQIRAITGTVLARIHELIIQEQNQQAVPQQRPLLQEVPPQEPSTSTAVDQQEPATTEETSSPQADLEASPTASDTTTTDTPEPISSPVANGPENSTTATPVLNFFKNAKGQAARGDYAKLILKVADEQIETLAQELVGSKNATLKKNFASLLAANEKQNIKNETAQAKLEKLFSALQALAEQSDTNAQAILDQVRLNAQRRSPR